MDRSSAQKTLRTFMAESCMRRSWAVERGYSSVDNAIKRHVPEKIDSAWSECAWECLNAAIARSPVAEVLLAFTGYDGSEPLRNV